MNIYIFVGLVLILPQHALKSIDGVSVDVFISCELAEWTNSQGKTTLNPVLLLWVWQVALALSPVPPSHLNKAQALSAWPAVPCAALLCPSPHPKGKDCAPQVIWWSTNIKRHNSTQVKDLEQSGSISAGGASVSLQGSQASEGKLWAASDFSSVAQGTPAHFQPKRTVKKPTEGERELEN